MSKFVTIDFEKCKGCWLCIEHCPNDLFKISKNLNSFGYKVIELINKKYCMGDECLKCINICPDNAIIYPDETSKQDILLTKAYWLGNKVTKKLKKY